MAGPPRAFEIRALAGVGDLIREGQKYDLVGRGLPYRGVKFEVQQRIQTTWYPGNPVALQQVMGATETNTVVNGIWKNRYLDDPTDPTSRAMVKAWDRGNLTQGNMAGQLVRAFEDLCRFAVPVEVRWGTDTDDQGNPAGEPTVRRGLIKRFTTTYSPTDAWTSAIGWEMEFEWRGREQESAKPVSVRLTDAREQLQAVADQLTDAQDQIDGLGESERGLLFGIPDAVTSVTGDVAESIGRMTEAIADYTAGVVGGIHADGGLLDGANTSLAIALMRQSVDTIRLGVEQIEALPLYAISVRDDALDLLSAIGDLFTLKQSLVATQATAAGAADDLAGQLTPDSLAEVQAPAGVDLRDLALQYYGDPDKWFVIAHYNGITGSRVPDNPDGPSDTLVTTIKIPRAAVVQGIGDVC